MTSATRAPLRCNNVLVPTVVPWRRITGLVGLIFPKASTIAREGAAGVEKTELSALCPDTVCEGAAGVDGDLEKQSS